MDTRDIFNPEGGLTDEAKEACRANNVDPSELNPRSLDSFKRHGVSDEGAQTLHTANKKKRAGLLHLVKKHI